MTHQKLLTILSLFLTSITGFRKGAIIQPILGSLRGSIGDNTFSHNRGGDYVRRRVSPTNPNTTRQQTMRALLSSLATSWSTALTSLQREAWNTWSSQQSRTGPLGNSINLTGINGFVLTNTHILDAGDTRIDDPPATVAPDASLTFSGTISAATTYDVTFTPTPLGAAERPLLFMSLPQSGAAEPNMKQSRIVGYGALAQVSPWAATLPFSVLVGQSVVFWLAVYDNATGLVSTFLRDYVTRV